jgi:hypothetical protein
MVAVAAAVEKSNSCNCVRSVRGLLVVLVRSEAHSGNHHEGASETGGQRQRPSFRGNFPQESDLEKGIQRASNA